MNLTEAKQVWANYRSQPEYGFANDYVPLLSPPAANLKFSRTNIAVYGLSLAQSRLSGHNVCPHSTPNCVKACVGSNGNGTRPVVVDARIAKTRFVFDHPEAFSLIMIDEITRAISRHGVGNVVFRLNTFSDIDWVRTNPEFFEIEGAEFYDYTKDWARVGPPNYRLCYSATERTTDDEIAAKVGAGHTVAVVINVRGGRVRPDQLHKTPVTDKGYRVIGSEFRGLAMIDGDASDNRYGDVGGVVVGLRAKGPMFGLAMAKEL